MKNAEVIKKFLEGKNAKNSTSTLSSPDNVLYSYQEPIALNTQQDLIVLTAEKFSQTTSRHTNSLEREARSSGFKIFKVKNI